MMNILRSTFSKNCRSGRSYGFSQSRRDFSGSPSEGSLFPPLAILSTLIGFHGYIINDLVNCITSQKRITKISEETQHFHNLFSEKYDKDEKGRRCIGSNEAMNQESRLFCLCSNEKHKCDFAKTQQKILSEKMIVLTDKVGFVKDEMKMFKEGDKEDKRILREEIAMLKEKLLKDDKEDKRIFREEIAMLKEELETTKPKTWFRW